MNVFDSAESLWKHRSGQTTGVSGGKLWDRNSDASRPCGHHGGAGARSVGSSAARGGLRYAGRHGPAAQESAGPGVRRRGSPPARYQAWVRAQCGQPTEVVTSASNA
jgi:hypothetical protein